MFLFLSQCREKTVPSSHQQPAAARPISSFIPSWSKNFEIHYFKDHKEILYFSAAGKTTTRYIVPTSKKYLSRNISDSKEAVLLPVNPQRVVTTSSTYIAVLQALQLLDRLKGVNEAPFICNQNIQRKLKQGEIVNLGGDGFFDIEKLLHIQADLMLQSAYETEGSVIQQQIRQSNIPCVLIRDYDEQHPLARAEWMIYIAAFFNEEKKAMALFQASAQEYIRLRNELDSCKLKRPVVICNLPWNDVWYMPGKDAYMTRLIRDAGASHPWEQEERNNSLNISLNYEQVFLKGQHAAFWLHPNSAISLGEVSRSLPQAVHFTAFANGKVYNNNRIRTMAGGNDFWESGVIFPHLILKDLMALFHPQFFPQHRLKYYEKLSP
jgi:iron complex transport system substrate-binding protein